MLLNQNEFFFRYIMTENNYYNSYSNRKMHFYMLVQKKIWQSGVKRHRKLPFISVIPEDS
jgi:hypothetical protein